MEGITRLIRVVLSASRHSYRKETTGSILITSSGLDSGGLGAESASVIAVVGMLPITHQFCLGKARSSVSSRCAVFLLDMSDLIIRRLCRPITTTEASMSRGTAFGAWLGVKTERLPRFAWTTNFSPIRLSSVRRAGGVESANRFRAVQSSLIAPAQSRWASGCSPMKSPLGC